MLAAGVQPSGSVYMLDTLFSVCSRASCGNTDVRLLRYFLAHVLAFTVFSIIGGIGRSVKCPTETPARTSDLGSQSNLGAPLFRGSHSFLSQLFEFGKLLPESFSFPHISAFCLMRLLCFALQTTGHFVSISFLRSPFSGACLRKS